MQSVILYLTFLFVALSFLGVFWLGMGITNYERIIGKDESFFHKIIIGTSVCLWISLTLVTIALVLSK